MSQGLVPVVFSFGVAPEIIDKKNGYIVHNLDEMILRINQLKNNPSKRAKMAENAIKTSKIFNSKRMISKYKKLYTFLIKSSKK